MYGTVNPRQTDHTVSMVAERVAVYGHRCSSLNGWDNGTSRKLFSKVSIYSRK